MRLPTIRIVFLACLAAGGATSLPAQDNPPSVVGVTPSSGSGWLQTFTFTYSDPDGGGTIASSQIIISNPTATNVSSFYLYIGFMSNAANMYLVDDNGSNITSTSPIVSGTPGVLQNSQCMVYPAGSSVSVSGNTLTFTVPILFKSSYAGARNIWVSVYDGTLGTNGDVVGSWTATAPPSPALSISSSHTGNFTQGQTNATYLLTVSDPASAGPTDGSTVTVTDTVPAGMTLVSMAGTGWTCSSNSCTRGDILWSGASYPSITATVSVAGNAGSPLTNQATVSGGGSASASASDSTTIAPLPVLSITSTHSGSFMQTQPNATYALTVSNQAGSGTTSGTVTVTETLPSGLTLVSMTGTGWTCSANVCTRGDGLAGGSSPPPDPSAR